MEKYFEFINSVKICSGENALENLPYELDFLGCHNPLILSDLGVTKAGVLSKITQILESGGVPCNNIFNEIPADSDISVIAKIASMYVNLGCDGLIACGGGSVIDTAKGVRLVLSQNNVDDILSLSGNEIIKKGKHLPFVVLPTTCGTGSECTAVAVIKNHETGVKMEFISSELLPDCAFVDVRLTETLPAKLIASSAMDALCHCIEAYSGVQKNHISDSFATCAIRLIVKNLPIVLKNPTSLAKNELALASTLAGIAFSNSMVGIVHAIGHACGGEASVPHGNAMTILLPNCMRYNLPNCEAEYGELLLYLAGAEVYASTAPQERAQKAIEFVENFEQQLNQLCGIPLRLSDYNVTEEILPKIAKKALNDGAIIVNKRTATADDIMTILRKSL